MFVEPRETSFTFADRAILLGLVLSILAIYIQVVHFDFIGSDDDLYVVDNSQVLSGLTPASIRWALAGTAASNWMPVTLLSHELDVELFGLRSGAHHLMNVVFHALASMMLFVTFRRATGQRWPSALVAFVFALHPLHVESVAWISERKDVLSALFWFLSLYAYVRYTERPSPRRRLWVVTLYCLALMAKPMSVTFPFVLLLFDVWPLRRAQWPKIVWEKLSLFAFSAASSAIAYWSQRSTGGVDQALRFDVRVANALIAYVTYIRQMFWPTRLAVAYPYPPVIEAWRAEVALVVLLGISILVIYAWRTRRESAGYLTTGWLWYLGTLVPVIGLVQVGEQPHADRYTYIPAVGLLVMLAWGGAEVVRKWPRTKPAIASAAVACCAACLGLAWTQTTYWRNSETLYQHAIDVTGDNFVAQNNLGFYLQDQPGRRGDAVEHFEAALRIRPDSPAANNNLGACLMGAGLCGAAIPHLQAALRASPNLAQASNNLGVCMMMSDRYTVAAGYFEAAVRMSPEYAEAHLNLARALSKIPGRALDAVAEYQTVLRLNPDLKEAHFGLAELLVGLGRKAEANAHFEAAKRTE